MIGLLLAASISGPPTNFRVATPPHPSSYAATAATASNNALCKAIAPFYWEIGDYRGIITSGSIGGVFRTTVMSVASASKMIYGAYVAELRTLTSTDINFLHFTSGYTGISDSGGSSCPSSLSPDTINQCLTQPGYSTVTPDNVGVFYYSGGHMENHASQLTALGPVVVTSLGPTIGSTLGVASLRYTEPLMSGGMYGTAADYAAILQRIVGGQLKFNTLLGTSAVCTQHSKTCNAGFSPIPEAWHYSIGHWVEDDPASNGDGAFSSPGAFGFYPWIDATKTYYGEIARQGAQGGGFPSAQCGRLIRRAWMGGVEQTGVLPQ